MVSRGKLFFVVLLVHFDDKLTLISLLPLQQDSVCTLYGIEDDQVLCT